MQNESETEFHRVYKVSPTQQLTKLTHLLRESGADVTGSMVDQVKLTLDHNAPVVHQTCSATRIVDQDS